jgi:hypothetical protein
MEPFLREFVYILTYGRNKYKDITRNIESIYKNRPYEICKLLWHTKKSNLKSFNRQRRPLGNGKIDEFSKISDSTYSFSFGGSM